MSAILQPKHIGVLKSVVQLVVNTVVCIIRLYGKCTMVHLNLNANLRKYVCSFCLNQHIKTLNIFPEVNFTSFMFALSLKAVVSSVQYFATRKRVTVTGRY